MTPDQFKMMREIIEEAIPFNRELGLELLTADDGKARVSLAFKDSLVGNPHTNILHGGVIASVLDVVGACAVMSTFTSERTLSGMGTVDLRVDYLLPGSGTRFFADGLVMRPGRMLSSTRMEFFNQDDQLLAIGTAIYRASRKDEPQTPNL